MVTLYAVIKVNDGSILYVYQGLQLDYLVIRLQDLISRYTFKPNKTFYNIREKGGIHNFLGFKGKIILSSIMPDKLIANFNEFKYSKIINSIKPDFYITPDGETYQEESEKSKQEIERCFKETCQLKKLCPDSIPIGLIKGCNKVQLLYHIQLLKSLGINDYVLHIGDFFRHANSKMKDTAKEYATLARKYANRLILYGMGSQKNLLQFSYADAYITFNYFVKAYYGKKYSGWNQIEYDENYSPAIVRHNLIEMIKNSNNLSKQKKLIEGGVCLWEAATEVKDQVMWQTEVQAVQMQAI